MEANGGMRMDTRVTTQRGTRPVPGEDDGSTWNGTIVFYDGIEIGIVYLARTDPERWVACEVEMDFLDSSCPSEEEAISRLVGYHTGFAY